jgi:hypothetical protein|tara:strand:+ start:2238 stop:2795 length:558 start_codon:yes stop_codon:yes gene_type:complete
MKKNRLVDAAYLYFLLMIWLNADLISGFLAKAPSIVKSRAPGLIGAVYRTQPHSILGMANKEDDEGECEEDALIEVDEDGIVYRKGKKSSGLPIQKRDNRDNMPYKTYIMMDDKARRAKLIATLRLDALTACGDLIDLGDRGVFEVVRVSFVYVWRGSSFVVTGKRLYCKMAKKQWANRVQNSLQ